MLGFSSVVSAQEIPSWVENNGVSPWISEQTYVTGYGIAALSKNDDLIKIQQIAEDNAKKNLAEKIIVQVKATSKTQKQQTGNYFEQKLESEIISLTDIELLGLKKEFYQDYKKGFAYCLVYVPKNYLIESYEFKILEKEKELESLFFTAQEFEKKAQKEKAVENFLLCYPLLSDIKNLQSVLLGLGKVPETSISLETFDIYQAINKLVLNINSLNDLAFFIAYAFKEQTKGEILKGVIVIPLTYLQTGMSSAFSKQFRESVEHQLIVHNKWETYPIKKYEPTIENMTKIKYAVKGNFWEDDEKLHINIYVNEILTGLKKASIEYEFDRNLIDEAFAPIKPDDYEKVKGEQDVFENNEINVSGLNLDIYTNKGQDGLIFTEGEKMKIYIKTNLPCYIQLIYHLSDTTRILFLNNEYLDVTRVNKVYELPFVFVCRPPFGVETLQVNAREGPFPKIDTYTENGLMYIKEDLSSILNKSREPGNNILQAEKRLTITTMPN